MKVFFAIFIASFFDPIRCIACICSAWFIRNIFGALTIGIFIPFAFTLFFGGTPNLSFLFIGALSSAVIVSIFHTWRKNKRLKASSATSPTN